MSINLAPVGSTLLAVNFAAGQQLNSSQWTYPLSRKNNNTSFYGQTQIRQSLPVAEDGVLPLKVDTYNPGGAGKTFLGTEVDTVQKFNNLKSGVAFTVRARLDNPVAGLVGGLYGYSYDSTTNLHNEIDYELLGNDAASNSNVVETNWYYDQPLGPGGSPGPGDPQNIADPSLTAFQTYTVEWFPNELLWFVNGKLGRVQTAEVPVGPLPFQLNYWVPNSGWPAAYSSTLTPASFAFQDKTYEMDVQSLSIASIADVNTTLTITGTSSKQRVADGGNLQPFANVVISDIDASATDRLSVHLSKPTNGVLSDLDGGVYNTKTGVYVINGSVSAVTAALEGLIFTAAEPVEPLANGVTTTFTIDVNDHTGATANNSSTSIVATSLGGNASAAFGSNEARFAAGASHPADAWDAIRLLGGVDASTSAYSLAASGAGFVAPLAATLGIAHV